jgi:hypothetical protein
MSMTGDDGGINQAYQFALLDATRHMERSGREDAARLRLEKSLHEDRPLHRENSACCWDLDSTLADTRHRFHLIGKIKAGEATWDEHSLACANDQPIESAIALMRLLAPHHAQHIVSGRSAIAEKLTHGWLARHHVPFDEIALRHPDDFTGNAQIKIDYVRKLRERGLTVVMFFEDYPPVAQQILEATGVPVVTLTPPAVLAENVTGDGRP